jgi:iron complex outermembrane recepter protein
VPEDSAEIIVTGSRIKRTIRDSLYPTIDLTADQIDQRGFFNVGEGIANQPIFSSLSNTDTDFNQSRQDVGFTFLNLFGLGTERTLTVVNGRRVVSSMSPQTNRASGQGGLQVDVSTIPAALIDRIETITVGGAPAYGADAIAGTVNIILKDRYEGLELDAQTGISGDGDVGNYRVQGVFGKNFAGGRGNIIVSGEYSKRNGLAQTDRQGANNIQLTDVRLATSPVQFFQTVPQPPINNYQRDTGFPGVSLFGTPSFDLFGFGPAAVFGETPVGFATVGTNTVMFNERGELVPVPLGNGTGTFLFTQNQPGFPGLYRGQDYVGIVNQSERYVLASSGRYDFSNAVALTFRVNYSDMKARQVVGAPISLGVGGNPIASLSINNPFLLPGARATLLGANAGPLAPLPIVNGGRFQMGKTLAEFGTIGPRAESQTLSAIIGLEGDFKVGERDFSWDVSYSWGRTRSTNTEEGVNRALFNAALDAVIVDSTGTIVTDPALYAPQSSFSFGSNGYTGANGQRIVCRSSVGVATSACLPFNPFGQQNPQEVINAIAFDSVLRTEIKQQFVQGNISGSLFDLPAGPFQFAAGAEYRDERAAFEADSLTATGGGLGLSGTIDPIDAGFTSTEAYGEIAVPLLSGEMLGSDFFDMLTLEASARYIDNNQSGSDWVWTVGGRLSLANSLTIRGNKTRSVRAPAIGQLVGSAPSAPAVADPCSVSQITRGPAAATRRENCVTDVIAAGRATDPASAATFLSTYTGAVGGIPGVVGGNPDLENEIADSWTLGAVFNPVFMPNLSLSVDWNDIRIAGAIQSLSPAQVVSSCYDSTAFPNQPSCGNFTRNNANFFLNGFRAGFVNTGLIDFAALTAAARLTIPLGGDRQSLSLNASWFHLDRFRDQAANGVVVENKGTVGFENDRVQAQFGYNRKGFTALWTTTYAPGAYLTADERDGTANVFEFDRTNASWVHDLSLIMAVGEDFQIRFIASNITQDQQPEQLRQFGSVQSRIGRTFTLGVNARF